MLTSYHSEWQCARCWIITNLAPKSWREKFCQYSCKQALRHPSSSFSLHCLRGIIQQHLTVPYNSCGTADQKENRWVLSRSKSRDFTEDTYTSWIAVPSPKPRLAPGAVPTVYAFYGSAWGSHHNRRQVHKASSVSHLKWAAKYTPWMGFITAGSWASCSGWPSSSTGIRFLLFCPSEGTAEQILRLSAETRNWSGGFLRDSYHLTQHYVRKMATCMAAYHTKTKPASTDCSYPRLGRQGQSQPEVWGGTVTQPVSWNLGYTLARESINLTDMLYK